MRIMPIYGTRPEAIKLAPVLRALRGVPGTEVITCVTGQHREMLDQVNQLFGIVPDVDLGVMTQGQSLTALTTAVLQGLEPVLREEPQGRLHDAGARAAGRRRGFGPALRPHGPTTSGESVAQVQWTTASGPQSGSRPAAVTTMCQPASNLIRSC